MQQHNSPPHEVFVAYSTKDQAMARCLVSHLRLRGISVAWDQDLAAGSDVCVQLEAMISSCILFVLLLSANSTQSYFVKSELLCAISHRVSVLPICIDGTTALPLGLVFLLRPVQIMFIPTPIPHYVLRTASDAVVRRIRTTKTGD